MQRRERHALLLLAAVVLATLLADQTAGLCAGVLHLVPFFAVLTPLLFGRFIGEDVLHRLRRSRQRPGARVARPRLPRPESWTVRSGHLLAGHFARPPPRTA